MCRCGLPTFRKGYWLRYFLIREKVAPFGIGEMVAVLLPMSAPLRIWRGGLSFFYFADVVCLHSAKVVGYDTFSVREKVAPFGIGEMVAVLLPMSAPLRIWRGGLSFVYFADVVCLYPQRQMVAFFQDWRCGFRRTDKQRRLQYVLPCRLLHADFCMWSISF